MYVHVHVMWYLVIGGWERERECVRERDRETEREGVREEHTHSTIPQHFSAQRLHVSVANVVNFRSCTSNIIQTCTGRIQ